jgi:hypothetical protein
VVSFRRPTCSCAVVWKARSTGFISQRPELAELWLRRHDDQASRKAVAQEFRIGTIFGVLEGRDRNAAAIARTLYERTIDFGGHPNERALSQVLRMERGDADVRFEHRYLMTGEEVAFGVCLKTTATIGVCALDLFRLVYQERMMILGLTDKLTRLKEGL